MSSSRPDNSALIFSLDTSSKLTSMALSRGARLIASLGADLDDKRSERLWAEARFLLGEVGASVRDVELFAVCTGPGGFTGVRIGLAAIKGFATATGKPAVGITSLEAAAFAAGPDRVVCAMVGAYRGEVYWQLFGFDEQGAPVAKTPPAVTTVEEALERVADVKDLAFVGDGVAASLDAIEKARRSSEAVVLDRHPKLLAEPMARLAFLRLSRCETASAAGLRACYVRPAEAEVKLSLGLVGSKIKRLMKQEAAGGNSVEAES